MLVAVTVGAKAKLHFCFLQLQLLQHSAATAWPAAQQRTCQADLYIFMWLGGSLLYRAELKL
jgi:hypothetical protein